MISSDFKWACIGDLQIPYHDPRAVELWFKVMKWWRPNAIDIVGDISDQLEYSSFSDGTTDEFFNQLKKEKRLKVLDLHTALERDETDEEFKRRISPLPYVLGREKDTADFYAAIRKQHKNADIHSSLGNHDIRVFKYLDKKMPEYLSEVTPESMWRLDSLGISWRHYDLPPFERFGGIHVHHGATTTTTGLAVRTDIETYNISLIRGHDHRGGVVYKSYPMTGRKLVGLGTGHMCDPKAYGLSYTINPAWELGFGIVHVTDGIAHPQFVPIQQGPDGYVCVVDGKVFKN